MDMVEEMSRPAKVSKDVKSVARTESRRPGNPGSSATLQVVGL